MCATTAVSLAGGQLSQGGRGTESGCASWGFRASVICPGRKAERSGGVLPPWATPASKNAHNQWRGLRPHTRTVWSTLNIIAARCARQRLPEPYECLRPTTGVRKARAARLWSSATAGRISKTVSPSQWWWRLSRMGRFAS